MQDYTSLLSDLYEDIYGLEIKMANLDELATELSELVGRSRPWTGKFLHSLIKGYPGFSANGQLAEALIILSSHRDGVDDVQARAKEAKVLTVHQLPTDTVILGEAQRCANPGCQVIFVPTHPRQKYHSKTCAAQSQRQKRNRKCKVA